MDRLKPIAANRFLVAKLRRDRPKWTLQLKIHFPSVCRWMAILDSLSGVIETPSPPPSTAPSRLEVDRPKWMCWDRRDGVTGSDPASKEWTVGWSDGGEEGRKRSGDRLRPISWYQWEGMARFPAAITLSFPLPLPLPLPPIPEVLSREIDGSSSQCSFHSRLFQFKPKFVYIHGVLWLLGRRTLACVVRTCSYHSAWNERAVITRHNIPQYHRPFPSLFTFVHVSRWVTRLYFTLSCSEHLISSFMQPVKDVYSCNDILIPQLP